MTTHAETAVKRRAIVEKSHISVHNFNEDDTEESKMADTALLTDARGTQRPKLPETSLVVEVELGQVNMPKPLLSGYFNSNLNSVENINQVARSLDSEDGLRRIKESMEEENGYLKSDLLST